MLRGIFWKENRKYSWLWRELDVARESEPHTTFLLARVSFPYQQISLMSHAPTSNVNLSLLDESAPFSVSAVGSWNAERNQLFARNPFSNSISSKLNYFRLENLFKRHNFSGVIFLGGRQKVFYESQPCGTRNADLNLFQLFEPVRAGEGEASRGKPLRELQKFLRGNKVVISSSRESSLVVSFRKKILIDE